MDDAREATSAPAPARAVGGAPRAAARAGVTPTADVVIEAHAVHKRFCRSSSRALRYAVADAARDLLTRQAPAGLREGEFWALLDVSFTLRRGESVGVMGANGAGKSTLLRSILGTLRLTGGHIVTRGCIAALTELGLGFDPALTGRENVALGAAVLGVAPRRVRAAFDEIVAFAELETFIDTPLRHYSTGMRARLGFAVAMALEPDVLLVDEVLAVGDVGFQRRCIEHARRYLEGGGSLFLVSHNPMLVQAMCRRCLVLDQGALVFDGDVVAGVGEYCTRVRLPAPGGGRGEDAADAAVLDPAALGLADEGFPAKAHGAAPTAGPAHDDTGGAREAAAAPIAIEAFGIRPAGDGGRLVTGEPATVFLRYRAARDVIARWGFCLLTDDLATTITCEGPWTPLTLRAGAGELCGTLPALPLAGGRFALRVAIMDPATDLPFAMRGYRDAPHRFGVDMPVNARNNYRAMARDLIVLNDVRWEPSPPPAGAERNGGESD